MTKPDLAKARAYLQRAEFAIDSGQSAMATPLAAIGTGYAQLAAAEVITAQPEPIRPWTGPVPTEYLAGLQRALRAADEARPHDGEEADRG